VTRTPITVISDQGDRPELREFLFGACAFVDATALARRTHRAGAFNSIAVAFTLAWSMVRTMIALADASSSRGGDMSPDFGDGSIRMHGADTDTDRDGMRYLMLASTLRRLSLGVKPFGRVWEDSDHRRSSICDEDLRSASWCPDRRVGFRRISGAAPTRP
jgi:hypothetical protein